MDNQVYEEGTSINLKYKEFAHIAFIIFCAVCAVVSLTITFSKQQKHNFLVEYGKSTQGEVTSLSHNRRGTPYNLQGHYTVGENVYEFSCSSNTRIAKGGFCTILYEEDNPSNYTVDVLDTSYISNYLIAFSFIAIGLVSLFLLSQGRENIRNISQLEFYNRNSSAEKRRKYIEETGDVWNIDLTNEEKNEKLYRSRQTTSNYNANSRFVRGNVGTTAFYGKDNDSSNL